MSKHREDVPQVSRYRLIGHSCHSDYPNRGGSNCEHVRIDSPMTIKEVMALADIFKRSGLEPHIFEA